MKRSNLAIYTIKEGSTKVCNPRDAAKVLTVEERSADRECFWVLHLNTKLRLLEKQLISVGSLDSTIAMPREVFKGAIINSAHAIITIHNHPSGDTEPSEDDKRTFFNLKSSGKILGIEVLDNLIVTKDTVYSYEAKRSMTIEVAEEE